MNKKLLIALALISILFLINSVNAIDEDIQTLNSTDDTLQSISNEEDICSINLNDASEKLGATFNQTSQIEVSDDCDDGELWVDDSSPNLKVKIKAGKTYSTDGKIIVECDGKTMEVNRTSQVGYDSRLGHIYGFNVYLDDIVNLNAKSVKNVKITFIGNLYKVVNKKTGEHLILPTVKNSTITIKVRTGTKTVKIDNGNFELTCSDYNYIKSGYVDKINIYYLNICTGTVKKLTKTTWKKKSVFVFKIGKTIKIGKKKFKTIKMAKKYVKNTFKVAFKGGKYIKMYKKGKKYYQLWKVPVKHYKKVKVYKEVKGEIRTFSDGIKLCYHFTNTNGNKVYCAEDLNV
ncbi:hypothetical protein [Methanobrevibacter sp.]|uniref:hypothetical protein n=1 Tax=Methanobrevibacter sp. TaxID=66852 RepID=UPI00386F02CA